MVRVSNKEAQWRRHADSALPYSTHGSAKRCEVLFMVDVLRAGRIHKFLVVQVMMMMMTHTGYVVMYIALRLMYV